MGVNAIYGNQPVDTTAITKPQKYNQEPPVKEGTVQFKGGLDADTFEKKEKHTGRNIAIGTNPYELFLDYGNQIKARSLAEQTFLIQLANGADGYLPTEKAEKGGHYSAFISSGLVGHEGGDQLVRETLSVINGMFKE